MTPLLPLVAAIPLLVATILALVGKHLPDMAGDVTGMAAAAAPAALAAILLGRTAHAFLSYWFGGWRPRAGDFPVGIGWAVDRLGAGLALLVLIVLTATLVYSWRYMEPNRHLYVVLMLAFGGAMAGFALSGDIFNMFVFFELMSVAAYALTAYKVEESSPLQGSFNFAVAQTIGGFFVLIGVSLLYGKTGSLNLAEIGRRLAHGGHGGLVVVSFGLIVCGFLGKAALVPFHFWHADAHAAAPAPVAALFSGVMLELGVYAVARIYWVVYAGALGSFEHPIRDILLGIGVLTAVVGALMTGLQRHVKRLLAYSTITHMGCFLIGVALLSPDALGGAAVYMIAHAFAKSALFLIGGVLLVARGGIDELLLHGKGKRLRVTAVAWFVAALALAAPPFLGAYTGHALIDDSASKLGYWWVPIVLAFASIGSTAAIFRAGFRIFLGAGDADDPVLSQEPSESPPPEEHPQLVTMVGVSLLLALAGLATGAWTGLATRVVAAAHQFTDRVGYTTAVLDHRAFAPPPPEVWHTTTSSIVWAVVTVVGAVVVGFASVYRNRLPQSITDGLTKAYAPLRAVHSGHVGDYVAWLTFGTAVIGGLFAVTIR